MNNGSFFQSVLITIVLAVVLRFFVLQPFIVDGASMEPNFSNNQYILIDKVSYRFRAPKRGEVVVFHPPNIPNENYIKRIVGLPGETVVIKNNQVNVDGHILREAYLESNQSTTQPNSLSNIVTLGHNEYFVLGDNREHSSDSRDWGPLQLSSIEGRTWFIMFPVTDFRAVAAPSYVF